MSESSPTPVLSREVPGGVRLLANLAFLIAVVKLIIGLLGFGLGAVFGLATSIFLSEGSWAGSAWGAGQLLGALLWFLVGWGLRGLKPWAWILAIAVSGFTVLTGIAGFLGGGSMAGCLGVLDFAIALAVLVYMFRRHVREAFTS